MEGALSGGSEVICTTLGTLGQDRLLGHSSLTFIKKPMKGTVVRNNDTVTALHKIGAVFTVSG